MRFGLIAALILSVSLPTVALAQSFGGGGTFSISVNPQYPAPNSQVTISVLSSSIDMGNATVTIYSGGKEIYKGNPQPVSIKIGRSGSITSIKISIVSNGVTYSRAISIQPQDVALVVEPVSSAHLLYQGKPTVPIDGNTRVVAVANVKNSEGKVIEQSALSYSWIVDDTRMENMSGIGRSSIVVASPLKYRSRSVSVDVASQDGGLVGGASVSLTAEEPSVRIYKNDPLFGILFDKALSGSYTISESEATLFALPFSLSTANGDPTVQWFLNGEEAQSGNSITLKPTGSGKGTASLSLTASSGGSSSATDWLSLIFGL